jgi:hypothetical protein
MKRSQQIGAHDIPPKTSLVQRWVDQGIDLSLGGRSLAPMHARILMMDRMEAVVEEHGVDEADKIAGVVVGRFFIRVNMLHVVENQHAKQRNLMGNHDKQ